MPAEEKTGLLADEGASYPQYASNYANIASPAITTAGTTGRYPSHIRTIT